jgi:hypothetical protein
MGQNYTRNYISRDTRKGEMFEKVKKKKHPFRIEPCFFVLFREILISAKILITNQYIRPTIFRPIQTSGVARSFWNLSSYCAKRSKYNGVNIHVLKVGKIYSVPERLLDLDTTNDGKNTLSETLCLVWVWNLVSHTKGRTQIVGVWEQGVENI